MGEKFSKLVQKNNQCNSNKDKHAYEESPLEESCEHVIAEVSSPNPQLVNPISYTSLELISTPLFTILPFP